MSHEYSCISNHQKKLVQANNKEIIEASNWLPFVGGIHSNLIKFTTKKTKMVSINGPLIGIHPNGFPSQRSSNVESAFMSWCHHVTYPGEFITVKSLESVMASKIIWNIPRHFKYRNVFYVINVLFSAVDTEYKFPTFWSNQFVSRNHWFYLIDLDRFWAYHVHSLWPSDAIWQHRSGSALAQVMACCLMATSHLLDHCWLVIRGFQWHSPGGNFTTSVHEIVP